MIDAQGCITARRKPLTATERRAVECARAFAACQQGRHSSTPTFRPGETVCLVCGIVVYCPLCLDVSHLPYPTAARAYPLTCLTHQAGEGQGAHTSQGKEVIS